jgi:anti-sigma regulatory factor (Ser/Thr protein kinase)
VRVGAQDRTIEHGGHVVHFYEHDAELVGTVCAYLIEALAAGEAVVLVATAAHLDAFEQELAAAAVDVALAREDGLFVSHDAAATLAAFSENGVIDGDAFHDVVGGLMRDASAAGRSVCAYGEMVALLWDRGDVLSAIELETLWNELGRELSFSLLCAYASASVAGSEHAGALERVCREHSAVLERNPAAVGERHAHTGACTRTHVPACTDLSMHADVSATFPAEPDSPRRARRMAAATLRRWGRDEPLVEDVSLVVSELASNAVRHAGSAFSLSLKLQGELLRVAVQDHAPLPAADLIAQPPHGLCVIDSLSSSWGVEAAGTGKLVWAQLTCAAPLATGE